MREDGELVLGCSLRSGEYSMSVYFHFIIQNLASDFVVPNRDLTTSLEAQTKPVQGCTMGSTE